jgi:hypothetical protein
VREGWVLCPMTYLVSWAIQAVFVVVLVLSARSRRFKCVWTREFAWRRLNWGIITVAIVQIATFIRNTTEGRGVGIFYHIQWIGIYWIALASFRLKDLKAESPAKDSQP